jgi:hypothetical protein
VVLTGAGGKTYTVAFSVAAAQDPDGSPNHPVTFATEWVAQQLRSNPAAPAILAGGLLAALALTLVGWRLLWRNRATARGRG